MTETTDEHSQSVLGLDSEDPKVSEKLLFLPNHFPVFVLVVKLGSFA
jgi:hypothetical protein